MKSPGHPLPSPAHSFLLLAPPGAGKTRFCIQKVRASLAQAPFAPVWVIVRDRLQAAAYRRKLVQAGAALGVEVATFSELYREILELTGLGMPVAEEAALDGLLRELVAEAYDQGRLNHYARLRAMPGFVSALRQAFGELKSSLVAPERLEALAAGLAAGSRPDQSALASALQETGWLYGAYQDRLRRLGWADEEGLSWLGLEALERQEQLLRDWQLVVIDGFDSFTPAQRRTVQRLSEQVRELWVTLPGEAGMARLAHRRFDRALRELQAGAQFELTALPEGQARLPDDLAALEGRLFEPGGEPAPAGGRVALLEARSADEEAREALRWLKARIVRDGLAPAECALIVPQFESYRPAILSCAAEFGLPVRLTRGIRLVDTPPLAALLDLLALPLRGYPVGLLLESVRAPFFDLAPFGLRRADAAALEIAARYGQVVEGLGQWEALLLELSQAREASEEPAAETAEEEEAIRPPALPRGARAAALWQGLQALAGRIQPPTGEQSLEEWVRWLVELLEALGYYRACAGPAEQAWLDALDRQLGALARSGRLVTGAGHAAGFAAFFSTLQGLLAETGAPDDIPGALETGLAEEAAIQVLHTFEARGLRFQAAALLGLSEGSFPAVEHADPFLPEPVRADLGIDARLGQDQAGIFYQLVARADQQLLLARPYLAGDGEIWEPSPFWNAVREVLSAPVSRVRPEDFRPLAEAASLEELLFWEARRQLPDGDAGGEILGGRWPERRQAIARGRAVLGGRMAPAEAPVFAGGLGQLADGLRQRFGDTVWSASRLEGYATCPFFFFAGSVLGLEMVRLPKAGFESFQLGSLLHEVLERVYRDCPEPRGVEAVLERLPAAARQVFAEAPRRYAFRPTLLWEVQQAELLETVRAAIVGLAELDGEAGWQPVAFECRFGIEGTPGLCLTSEGQTLRLRGLIDRVDRDRHGNLRVIDYKSGSAHLGLKDLLEGRRLQLPVYALAVEQALEMGRVVDGLYWTLFSGQPGGLRLARFHGEAGAGPEAAYATAVSHALRLVAAIQSGDFTPCPPEGGCPSYCPVASWCWSYRPRPVY